MELPQRAGRMTAITVSLKGKKGVFEGKQAYFHDSGNEGRGGQNYKSGILKTQQTGNFQKISNIG